MRDHRRGTKRPLPQWQSNPAPLSVSCSREPRPEFFPPNVHAPAAKQRPLGVSKTETPAYPLKLRRITCRKWGCHLSAAKAAIIALVLVIHGSAPARSVAIDLQPKVAAAAQSPSAPTNSRESANKNTNGASAVLSPSHRLCTPPEEARAYVTTLANESDREGVDVALGPRVLAQSLRMAGAKGDIVVLVSIDRYTGTIVDALRRDGLTVYRVPRGLQSGETKMRQNSASILYGHNRL